MIMCTDEEFIVLVMVPYIILSTKKKTPDFGAAQYTQTTPKSKSIKLNEGMGSSRNFKIL